jgi:hypothetical protein
MVRFLLKLIRSLLKKIRFLIKLIRFLLKKIRFLIKLMSFQRDVSTQSTSTVLKSDIPQVQTHPSL